MNERVNFFSDIYNKMTSRYRYKCCTSQPVAQQYVPVYAPPCCPVPPNTDPRRFSQAYCPPTRSFSEPLSHAEYLRRLKANNTAPISSTNALVQYGEGEYRKTIWTENAAPCCPGGAMPAVPAAQTQLDEGLRTESKGAKAAAIIGLNDEQGVPESLHTLQKQGQAIFTEECPGVACRETVPDDITIPLIYSKNNVSDGGFQVGGSVTKDMGNEDYRDEFDPYTRQNAYFPGMADFIDGNIVQGDKAPEQRLNASYWNDWGNDVFDEWGYFYLYDTESGKYYLPLLTPQNQGDGVIATQVFNAFGRTFTIKHGWSVQGIFKFDISVNDNKPFRFGTYGDMGSDGDEDIQNFTQAYSIGTSNFTLFYQKHAEIDNSTEILYSYWIPKKPSQNNSITYDFYNDGDENSMMSKEVTNGLLVYFAKKFDVKDWVINDLGL